MERLPSSDNHNWSSSFFWIFFCPLFQTHLYSFSNQNLLPLWRLFGSPSSGFFFLCVPLAIFSYNSIVIMCAQPLLHQYVAILWEWGVSLLTPHSDCYIMKTFLQIDMITTSPHNLTNLWESPWDSVHIISSFYYLLVFWLSFFFIYLVYNFKLSVWAT